MNNTLSLNLPISISRSFSLKFSIKAFWILSILLIGALLAFYVFQIISIIQKTYLLQNYEKELTFVSKENQNLEIKLARLNALENIDSLVKDLNYEKIEKIRYIQVIEPQVVKTK